MRVQVIDINNRTKNFKFDGRHLNKFIKELLQANPQGIKELLQYSHIENTGSVGVYKELKNISFMLEGSK